MNMTNKMDRAWVRSVLEEWGEYCSECEGYYRGGNTLQSNFPKLESPGYDGDVWTELDERMRKVTVAVGGLDDHLKEAIKHRYQHRCAMEEVARRLRVTTRSAERYEAAACDALFENLTTKA